MRTINADSVVRDVIWCPSATLSLVAVACDKDMLIFNSNLGDKLINMKTEDVLNSLEKMIAKQQDAEASVVTWTLSTVNGGENGGAQLKVTHPKMLNHISWHAGADYVVACMSEAENSSVLIHQVSLCRTQSPFKKSKGLVQSVLFHPTRPLLFVAVSSLFCPLYLVSVLKTCRA